MSKIHPRIIRVSVDRLQLDHLNPRLPESLSNQKDQQKLWEHMKKAYDLKELALSMISNGYFEAEPLVAIPTKELQTQPEYDSYEQDNASEYIIVEGNRRLATIRGLIDKTLFDLPELPNNVREQFQSLPVLFYPNRAAIVAFLAVHHLAGMRKWEPYQRARYIAKLKSDGYSLEAIQEMIGDRKNSAKKTYVCYRLVGIMADYDESFSTKDAKGSFSLLQLATGQGAIRNYIGLPTWNQISDLESPIPRGKYNKLKFLFEYLFNSNDSKRVITESRDITKRLARTLEDPDATAELERSKNLDSAFEMIGGELIMMEKNSSEAKRKLELVIGKLASLNPSKIDAKKQETFDKFRTTIEAIDNIVNNIQKQLNQN